MIVKNGVGSGIRTLFSLARYDSDFVASENPPLIFFILFDDPLKIGFFVITGTLVVVYNLKLMDNGEPELDVSIGFMN